MILKEFNIIDAEYEFSNKSDSSFDRMSEIVLSNNVNKASESPDHRDILFYKYLVKLYIICKTNWEYSL